MKDLLEDENEKVVVEALHSISLIGEMSFSRMVLELLGKRQFEAADIQAAINFRRVAADKNLKNIIYLGGLGDIKTSLSAHLKSRTHVAARLKKGTVPTTILRAAIIIGSGSASYEIIENLVRNCIILPAPSWARTKCQPIAVRDVIKYLLEYGAEVNTIDRQGKTPLTRAEEMGRDDIAKLLKEYGADEL